MNSFDVARNLRTPGVVVTAHIDTKLVSKRIFNAAHRMVDSLIFKGGYRSQSIQLAKALAHRHGVPTVRYGYSSVSIWRGTDLTPEVIAEIETLLGADSMIEKGRVARGNYGDYVENHNRRNKERLRALGGIGYTYLMVHTSHIQPEIAKVLANYWLSDPNVVKRRDAAVRELTSGAPIPFDPYTDYN